MDLSQVLPTLFVGSCPSSADDICRLKADYGITGILSLQTEHDLDYCDLDWSRLEACCQQSGIAVRRVPIRAFDGLELKEKLPQCLRELDDLMRDGATAYVHCNVGANRSPGVAVAYLVWRQGWNVDDAVEQVTRHRSCSPIIEAIVAAGRDGASG